MSGSGSFASLRANTGHVHCSSKQERRASFYSITFRTLAETWR